MRVIDARSGQDMVVNQTIQWGDGESITLLAIHPGWVVAEARARIVYRGQDGRLVTSERWVPLQVRWTHPRFFLQHVAFFPS